MKQRKAKAGSVLQSDSAQRVTDQIAGLQSSKPSALPSKMPSLMSVLRKDSVDMATTELYIKPQPETKKVESLVKAPKAPPIGPELAKSLNSEDKKLKARYRMQGWLQIAAGVAGLAGSYLAYSAIKTDYDAYSAKMEKLNTEYSNWQAVSRQPLGTAVTPLSMTSYGKPATYGVYAGGAISLGAVINGIRFLGKAGKIKSKSNPSLPNTIPSPPPTIISNKK
ncbi:hypothetical protein GO730_28365 [Spirosoma sp. HMF3257]|nr:hypothetical protein [Spirosoma telluris]